MARPVFQNEVIGKINNDYTPQYNIEYEGGLLKSAKLHLQNPITSKGTPHNADIMNRLFDFDNLAGMKGNTCSMRLNADGSIIESIKNSDNGIINATRSTSFLGNKIAESTVIYDETGTVILRNSTILIGYMSDGTIEEVVI